MRSTLPKLFFLIIALLVGFFLYQKLNSRHLVQAEWFNDSWAYRNYLPITSHTVGETNVYVTATLNIGSTINTQSDLGDLRITLQNGQIVPHFLISGSGTTAPVIHIYLKDFPAGAQTLYYYYGHSTVQNGFAIADFPTQAASYVVGTLGTQEKTQGPLAYLKFDEGYGTSTQESITRSSIASFGTGSSSPTWKSEENCISGKCLSFDGNDAIILANQTNLQITGPLTLSAWVKLTDSASTHDIVTRNGSAGSYNYRLYTDTNGKTNMEISSDGTAITTVTGNTTLANGTWYHLSGVYVPSTSLTIYINGVQDGQNTTSIPAAINNSPSVALNIGSENNGVGSGGATFVQECGDSTAGATSLNVSCNTTAGNLLVVMIQTRGGLSTDWSVHDAGGNTWTECATCRQEASGVTNSGWLFYSLTTTSNTSIGISATDDIRPYTVSIEEFSGIQSSPFDQSSSSGEFVTPNQSLTSLTTATTSQALEVAVGHLGVATTTTITGTGTGWTYNNQRIGTSESIMSGYKILTSTGTETNTGTSNNNTRWTASVATFKSNTPSVANFFSGTIDDVKIYNYARTPSQISADYNSRGAALPKGDAAIIGANRENTQSGFTGPVGYWQFDEATGTTAFDNSGNSNNSTFGTGNSSPTWATGKFGKSLYFDGTNEFTSVGSTINTINSVSFWVKPTTTSQYFLDFDGGTHYISASAGKVTATGFATPTILVNGVGTTVITASTWQHISVTTGTGFTGSNITFGRSTTNFYNGYLDDLRLYNYTRTQKQIIEDMNAGHPFGGSPVGSQVAYYKFDEDYGSTAYNTGSGGSTFNGTLGTGTSAPSRTNNGQSAKALSFDGTTDYVSIGSTIATLQTISFWLNPSGITNNKILSLSSTVSIGATGNTLSAPGFSSPTYYVNGLGTSLLTNNIWQHVVISTGTTINANAITFGKSSTSFFTGLLDEVKIYSGVLTANDIKIDYNQGRATNFGSISQSTGSTAASNSQSQAYCVPGDATSCNPPIGIWNFNEGTGTSIFDSSGNNYSTVFGTGTSTPSRVSGKIGQALSFNGTTNNLLINSSIDNLKTISFYIRPIGTTTTPIMTLDSTHNINLTTNTIAPNGFTSPIVYVNGVATTLVSNTNIWNHVAITSTTATTANAINFGQVSSAYFSGYLDQVTFYDYVRTPAQVALDYNRGQPISWFKLDECQGNLANDSLNTGIGNTIVIGAGGSQPSLGTCAIGATTAWGVGASGRFNASLNFDGTDDYVNIPSNSFYNTNNSSWSVAVWIKDANTGNQDVGIVSRKQWSGIFPQWILSVCGSSNCGTSGKKFVASFYQDYNNIYRLAVSNTIIADNTWHHLVMVANKDANVIKLYIDGRLDATGNSGAGAWPDVAPVAPVRIGNNNSSGYFKGQIDDVRIYNYALNLTQIKTIYNGNFAVRFGPPATP